MLFTLVFTVSVDVHEYMYVFKYIYVYDLHTEAGRRNNQS